MNVNCAEGNGNGACEICSQHLYLSKPLWIKKPHDPAPQMWVHSKKSTSELVYQLSLPRRSSQSIRPESGVAKLFYSMMLF